MFPFVRVFTEVSIFLSVFFEIVNICRFFTDDLEGDKIEGSLLEGRRRFTVFF